MFKKIQYSFLEKNVRQAGVFAQVEASKHLSVIQEVLRERFGDGADKQVRAKYIKYRTVTIEIVHPAIAQEIRLQEEAIISEINKRIGRPEVVSLSFTPFQIDELTPPQ